MCVIELQYLGDGLIRIKDIKAIRRGLRINFNKPRN